jgi:hypothetical protein
MVKSEDSKLCKYLLLLSYCVRLQNIVSYNEGIICQVIENTVIRQEYEANKDRVSNSRQLDRRGLKWGKTRNTERILAGKPFQR